MLGHARCGYRRVMALRWYTVVVDCRDIAAQSRWWARVLDWRLVYEDEKEAVIIPRHLSSEPISDLDEWLRAGQGLVFVPVSEPKTVKNRVHIDLAPHSSQDRDAEIDRLLSMGATQVDVGQRDDVSWTVLADPEGNEFCVLSSRER